MGWTVFLPSCKSPKRWFSWEALQNQMVVMILGLLVRPGAEPKFWGVWGEVTLEPWEMVGVGPYSPCLTRKVRLRGVAKKSWFLLWFGFDQAFILFWDWDGAIFFP